MQHSATATLPRPAFASASPLAGLAGTDLSRRFRHWRGASGRRHLFSVFPVERPAPGEDAPCFADAVVMAVGRDADGERRILSLDETGPLPDPLHGGALFRAAAAKGADEIHVHLLADGPAARAAVMRDFEAARGGGTDRPGFVRRTTCEADPFTAMGSATTTEGRMSGTRR